MIHRSAVFARRVVVFVKSYAVSRKAILRTLILDQPLRRKYDARNYL